MFLRIIEKKIKVSADGWTEKRSRRGDEMPFAVIPCMVALYCGLSSVIFVLAIFGIACPPAVIIPAFLVFGIGLSLVWKQRKNLFFSFNYNRITLLVSLGILIAILLPVLSIPPYLRDDLIYHLFVPKFIAATGKFIADPFNITTNFPMIFEMPLVVLHVMKNFISPYIVNLAVFAGLAGAIYAFGRRHFRLTHWMALCAMILFMTTPVVVDLVHSCYVELFFTLNILIGLYYYLIFIENRAKPRYWFVAMSFFGIAGATKYLGLIFLIVLAGYEFFRATNRKSFYSGVLIAAAIFAPWYIKTWIVTGNPVYPFANEIFRSPYVSVTQVVNFKGLLSDYNAGRSAASYLLLPLRLLAGYSTDPQVHKLGFDGKLSIFFIAAVFGLGVRSEKKRVLSLIAASYCALWVCGSQQVRFLLPALIPLSLAGLNAASSLKRSLRLVFPFFCAIVLIQNAWNIGKSAQRDGIIDLIIGKIDRETFLTDKMPVSYGTALKVNQLLRGSNARIMTVGTFGRNYYFDVPVFSNTFYEEGPFDRAFSKVRPDTAALAAFLQKNKISHVLFNLERYNPATCDSQFLDCAQRSRWFAGHFKHVYFDGKGLLCKIQ
jgi:hypothetical protein